MAIDRREFAFAAASVGALLSLASGSAQGASAQAALAVDEGGFVNINGVAQWIGLRGYDARNPVMLFLHGGPGMGITHGAPVFDGWEKLFTVAYWDMPHGGATHAHNLGKDEGPITVERYVRDAIAVAEHVKARTGDRKIVVFGISFGSRVGIEIVHRRPDLFSAYVGTAQVVSGPRGNLLGYELALEKARERGDAVAVRALTEVGPPPYTTVEQFLTRQAYTNPPGMPSSAREVAANAALAKFAANNPIKPAKSVPAGLPAFDPIGQFMAVQAAIFQDSGRWDCDVLGRRFEVPVFVFQGTDDLNTPFALARDWVARIEAPAKVFAAIEGASHNTIPFHTELLGLLTVHVAPVVRG